jgi:Domain of unknown function (DUF4126)
MVVEQMIGAVAAVAAGGTLGASDQFLCLLLLGVAANYDLVSLPPEVAFMKSLWFLAVVAVIWIIDVAAAYSTFVAPGAGNIFNFITNSLGGILVPASGALLAVATAHMVQVAAPAVAGSAAPVDLRLVGGAGAATATLVTFVKFLLKPMAATATGTVGTISAPVFETLENVAAVVLMGIMYVLIQIDPWLLAVFVFLLALALLAISLVVLYKLWQTGQGIGQVIKLIETNPKAGLAVMIEPFVWGGGWALYRGWKAAQGKLALWAIALFVLWFALPTVFIIIPPIAVMIPIVGSLTAIYVYGLRSAQQLLKTIRADGLATGHRPRAVAPKTV